VSGEAETRVLSPISYSIHPRPVEQSATEMALQLTMDASAFEVDEISAYGSVGSFYACIFC
jgi:hypothetical protein